MENWLTVNEAPSKTTVYKLFAEVKRGSPRFDDNLREGRSCTFLVAKNIDAVGAMILEE